MTPFTPTAGSRPAFIYPVYGFAADMMFKREDVANFFDWSAATDLVSHPARYGFEQRNLYIGVPQYSSHPLALTAAVERDLRFTLEMQRKDAA